MDVSCEPLPSCPQLCLRDSIRFCTIEASKRVPLLLLRLTRLGPLLLLRLTRLGLFDAMLFLDAKQGVRFTAATPCGFGDRLFCLVNLHFGDVPVSQASENRLLDIMLFLAHDNSSSGGSTSAR